jgi:hypothetical protein
MISVPAGTAIFFRDVAAAEQFQAVFINECKRVEKLVTLTVSLKIATFAWIADRDDAVIKLSTELEKLRASASLR